MIFFIFFFGLVYNYLVIQYCGYNYAEGIDFFRKTMDIFSLVLCALRES